MPSPVNQIAIYDRMKTQILQLEAHDDIISTRDKLGWGQTGRVVLVWPKRSSGANPARVLHNRLDLVMLQRHSASLGLQIALVTHDAEVRFYARQLRIPVFNSLDEAQRAHWRGRRRLAFRKSSQEEAQKHNERIKLLAPRLNAPRATHAALKPLHPALRWSLFSLALLSLLALAASILPAARITLQPETRQQEIAFNIAASPAHKEANLSGEVPAQVRSVIVERRSNLPVTGKIQVPEKAAVVRVRFTNLTEETVEIPQGLIISTVPQGNQPATRFITTESGRVQAGVGEFASLPVRAIQPGRSGNLPAGSLAAIEGPLGLSLSVTNLLPASGGSDLPAPAPAPDDYTRLNDELMEALLQDALSDLRATLASDDLVITPTLKMVETLESTYDPPLPVQRGEGDGEMGGRGDGNTITYSTSPVPQLPATQLRLFLRLKFEALVISGTDLRSISARILNASLPEDYTPIPDSLEIIPWGLPRIDSAAGESAQDTGNPSIRWRVVARRLIQVRINPDQITRLTRGVTVSQTEQFLSAWLPLRSPPVVSVTPAWWPRLPWLPTRIIVDISSGQGAGP